MSHSISSSIGKPIPNYGTGPFGDHEGPVHDDCKDEDLYISFPQKAISMSGLSRFLIVIGATAIIFVFASFTSDIIMDSSWQDIISGFDKHRRTFEKFIEVHGKEYINSDEESYRFEIFKKNLNKIAERNKEEQRVGGSAIHGVNFFTDLTEDEIYEKYANLRLPDNDGAVQRSTIGPLAISHPDNLYSNWVNEYVTPSINVQGECGSCWAFTSAEQIEADVARLLRPRGLHPTELKLSIQQLIDCVYHGKKSNSCTGGWISTAYRYVMSNGLERAKDDPYLAYNRSFCSGEPGKYAVRLKNYTEVWGNETWMAQHVLSTGPLAVAVNSAGIGSYSKGVLRNCGPDKSVSHGMQIVGLNLDDSKNPYWILRNSWGPTWGENGYLYLGYGQNLCNVSYYASYTEPLWYRPNKVDFLKQDDHPEPLPEIINFTPHV